MPAPEPLKPEDFLRRWLTQVFVSETGIHARILPQEFSLDQPEPVMTVTVVAAMTDDQVKEAHKLLTTQFRSIWEVSPTRIEFDVDPYEDELVFEGVVTWRREPYSWDDALAYYRGVKSALERERTENRELYLRLRAAERFVDRTIDRHEKLMAARPDLSENLAHRIKDLRSVQTVLERK